MPDGFSLLPLSTCGGILLITKEIYLLLGLRGRAQTTDYTGS
jgi:hypothetical protein